MLSRNVCREGAELWLRAVDKMAWSIWDKTLSFALGFFSARNEIWLSVEWQVRVQQDQVLQTNHFTKRYEINGVQVPSPALEREGRS